MFKILSFFLLFISLVSWAERRNGRHPAIVLEPKTVLKELSAGSVKEAKIKIQEILKSEKKGSATRNKAVLYQDSLNSLSSAPVRQEIYHGDSLDKMVNRFATRLKKGFTLKTIFELSLFGFLLSSFFLLRKKKKNLTKAKSFHVTEELFTLQTFKLLKKKLKRDEYFRFKKVIKEVIDEVNFLVDYQETVLIDYHFNRSRFLLIFNFPKEHLDLKNKQLLEGITPILKSLTPRYYFDTRSSKELVISLDLQNLSLVNNSINIL